MWECQHLRIGRIEAREGGEGAEDGGAKVMMSAKQKQKQRRAKTNLPAGNRLTFIKLTGKSNSANQLLHKAGAVG